MSEILFIPNDTVYRKLVNFLKSNYTLLVFLKILNPGRRVEISNIKKGFSASSREETLLDIGCGDGYWTRYFGRNVAKAVGLEPYKDDLEKAQKYATSNSEFLEGTAEDIPFQDETFDKIISVCVFEHLYNDVEAFKEFVRVLKSEGTLLATVDSLNSPYVSQKHREWHMKACYCKQLYSIDSICEKLYKAGFKNVQANYIMGSRVSIFWEILMEKIGVFAFFLLPFFWPSIMLLERKYKKSGYKIFVKAVK